MYRLLALNCFLFVIFIFLSSCATNRNLTYFKGTNSLLNDKQSITNKIEPVIQPGDLLSITVNSLNPESNLLFNTSVVLPPNNALVGNEAAHKAGEGYLVDKEGMIRFLTLNKIKLAGLTLEEAIAKMTEQLAKSVKSPIVNISFLNFRITVLGEVSRPSSFIVPNEHVSVLEALGLAGDMTIFGKRETVLVIREKDGVRTVARLDLTNKETLTSPYFYLQQNDVVYVEPDKARSLQASSRTTNLPIYISVASIIAVLISSLAFRQ
jgi:polysaccharide export outer membrane protein